MLQYARPLSWAQVYATLASRGFLHEKQVPEGPGAGVSIALRPYDIDAMPPPRPGDPRSGRGGLLTPTCPDVAAGLPPTVEWPL